MSITSPLPSIEAFDASGARYLLRCWVDKIQVPSRIDGGTEYVDGQRHIEAPNGGKVRILAPKVYELFGMQMELPPDSLGVVRRVELSPVTVMTQDLHAP